MPVKFSHTAVSCRCTATQTISINGPGGRERMVASVGRAVIDLKRSLIACDKMRD